MIPSGLLNLKTDIRIVMGDPSGTIDPFDIDALENLNIKNDPFGVAGISVNLEYKKIRVRLAKQFNDCRFETVANYFKLVQKTVKPHVMGLETNNRGKDILKLFKSRYELTTLIGVNTSANMTEESRQRGFSMDKPYMTRWFGQQKDQLHNIIFPEIPTKDMSILQDQISQMVSIPTPNGSTTFKAARGGHDDIFLALLHCCNLGRILIEQYHNNKRGQNN